MNGTLLTFFNVQVTKADVDAALGVMNFAIYHKELTDMDEREAERAREQEIQKKRMAEAEAETEDQDANDSVPTDEGLSTANRLENSI